MSVDIARIYIRRDNCGIIANNYWGEDIMTKDHKGPHPSRPGIAGIVISIILMVCGPVIGGGVIVYSTMRSASQIDAAQTFVSNGTAVQVRLTGSGEMGIWVTRGGHGSCQVYDPKLVSVSLSTNGFTRQSAKGYDLAGTFIPSGDGTYTIMCSSSDVSFTFKIAPVTQPKGSTTLIIAGVVIIVVIFLVGLVLLIAMLVRRYGWHEDDVVRPARAITSAPVPQQSSRAEAQPRQPAQATEPVPVDLTPAVEPPIKPELTLPVEPTLTIDPAHIRPPQVWPPTYTEPPQNWDRPPQSPYGDEPGSE